MGNSTLVSGLRTRTAALVLACGMLGGTAHAGVPLLESGTNLNDGAAMELGVLVTGGKSDFAQLDQGLLPNAQGFVIRDRNGLVARSVLGLMIAIAGALAQSGPKSVERNSYRSGDWIVTETKTTYYSEAEKAEMRAATSQSIDALFSMKNSEFELQVYSRDRFGYGDTSGYKLNMYAGTGSTIVFESGLGWGSVNSIVVKDGMRHRLNRDYLGMPLRLSAGIGPVRAAATFEWNWLAHTDEAKQAKTMGGKVVGDTTEWGVYNHPFRLDLQAALLGRVYVSGGAVMPSIGKANIGWQFGLGGRF